MLPMSGGDAAGQGGQVPGAAAFSPFDLQHPQLAGAPSGQAGGTGGVPAALLYGSGGGGSTGSLSGGGISMSLQDQQALASGQPMGQLANSGAVLPVPSTAPSPAPTYNGAMSLPILPPTSLTSEQLQAVQMQLNQLHQMNQMGQMQAGGALSMQLQAGSGSMCMGMPPPLPPVPAPAPSQYAAPSSQQGAGASGAAAKPAKVRQKRPYKPPETVQAERKHKAEVQEHIRKLEQHLGRARLELEQLQQENKVLHRKANLLSKHSSFRRCAAVMAQDLMQSMTLTSMDWSQQSACKEVLDAAERGLPAPQVLDQLRSMSVEEAVRYYNGVVVRVRELLHKMDHGADRLAASKELDDIFTLTETTSTFGYLQVVNPPLFAQLMETKLDPSSPVERADPGHWRHVLAAMLLTEEQEAQLIMLLQSHLQQAEQIVRHKGRVMAQLAEELSHGLLSLELSGSSEVQDEEGSEASGGAAGSGGGGIGETHLERAFSGQPSSPGPLQAKDELDALLSIEYWLKLDFTGCVRKLLPPQQQALCMVSSWPFYPDQKQLEAAIKEKAGQLWDQLQRSSSS